MNAELRCERYWLGPITASTSQSGAHAMEPARPAMDDVWTLACALIVGNHKYGVRSTCQFDAAAAGADASIRAPNAAAQMPARAKENFDFDVVLIACALGPVQKGSFRSPSGIPRRVLVRATLSAGAAADTPQELRDEAIQGLR